MTWGGARNRAISHALTAKQMQLIYGAANAAIAAGLAFNRFVTVHWTALDIDDAEASPLTGRLIKLASDWCATKGIKMTWAWVRENDAGDMTKGSHVHILLHCPADVRIGRMWRRWLRRLIKRRYATGAVTSRSIGPTLISYGTNPQHYRENLGVVLAYVCKGTDSDMGGRIIGKRAARWQKPKL